MIIKATHGMVTYIVQGIGCSIHQLTYQTFNAKCKIIILVFSEPLSIQNEMYDAGTDGWCEKLFGMYVKTANMNIHSSGPQATKEKLSPHKVIQWFTHQHKQHHHHHQTSIHYNISIHTKTQTYHFVE
jgi:hypothetical protein